MIPPVFPEAVHVALRAIGYFPYISMCTGGGGLEIGTKLAVPGARAVCIVEIEAFAAEVLASAMDAGRLAQAPLWTDARTFDGRPWRGRVRGLVAGYPCQPFSLAGKRNGAEDPRHLWPQVARVIREAEPDFVFLENVAGHLHLGLREVVGELLGMDYRVAVGIFRAEEVGASHRRERLFILAHAQSLGEREQDYPSSAQRRGWPGARPNALRGGEQLADLGCVGVDRIQPEREPGIGEAAGSGGPGLSLAHANSGRLQGERLGGLPDDGDASAGHDANRRGGQAVAVGNARGQRRGEGRASQQGQQRQPPSGVAGPSASCTVGVGLADSDGAGRGEQRGDLSAEAEHAAPERAGKPVAHPEHAEWWAVDGTQGGGEQGGHREGQAPGGNRVGGQNLAHADFSGVDRLHERNEPGHMAPGSGGRREGHEAIPYPPGPDDADGWREYLSIWPGAVPALSVADFAPSGAGAESQIRGSADGLAPELDSGVCLHDRLDRLRVLGNGVVPEQAAYAFAWLYAELLGIRIGPRAKQLDLFDYLTRKP